MQIFKKTKKYVTGIIYTDKLKDSIVIPDKSKEALKILDGYKFSINGDKIVFTGEQEVKKDKKYYLTQIKTDIDKNGVTKENIKALINQLI